MKLKNKKTPLLALAMMTSAAYLSAEATEIGRPAPQFTLPSLQQGEPVALKDKLGKVIYLDFWASWCAPCRTSFPLLNKLHDKLKAQGFEVVGVSLDENKDKAVKFLQEIPVNFTVLHDAKGEWADQYVVESMPTSFIIDKQGVVQHIHHGFKADDIVELEGKVTELLKH